MKSTSLINNKIVRGNVDLKLSQKQEKWTKGKGSRKYLKNYLGKVVSLSSSDLIGKESGVSNFIADISKADLLTALENAGITGMSGNGFSIHKKINTFLLAKSAQKIMLINAVECDPALWHDEWLLANRSNEITQAIHYLSKALSLKQVVLATKNKNIKSNGSYAVSIVPPRYPMGEEHCLIRQICGTSLEKKDIPAEHGFLVLNIQSIYQICKIVNQCYDGGRFITIVDLTKASAKIAYIYPTDNISSVLNKGFNATDGTSLYRGYGIMSCTEAAETDDFSGHETFAAYANSPKINNANRCHHCGSCNRRCPVKIKVAKVIQAVDKNKALYYSSYSLDKCIKCGSCTYFCPASKNVSGYITEILEK